MSPASDRCGLYITEPCSPPKSPPEALQKLDPLPNCIPPSVQPCPQSESSPDTKPVEVKSNSPDVHQDVTCWGKVFAPKFINSQEDTILECLNKDYPDLGLILVKRKNKIIKGIKTPTNTHYLKFKRAEPPDVIYIFEKPHKCEKIP